MDYGLYRWTLDLKNGALGLKNAALEFKNRTNDKKESLRGIAKTAKNR